MADTEPVESGDVSATEAEERSRLRGYDKRLEEWLASLKEEAGQRSPEVLSALAAKAKDVAEYLERWLTRRVRGGLQARRGRLQTHPAARSCPKVRPAQKTDD
jgi:hypothetical protein